MPLNSKTKRYLAHLRASNTDAHGGFGQWVAKAWRWRGRERLIICKDEEIGRGHVRQNEEISAEKADLQTMKRIRAW